MTPPTPTPRMHSMSCEYPEGCSCGASAHNRLLDKLTAARAQNERLTVALSKLSARMESAITKEEFNYLPDHACAECVGEDGELVKKGFQCGRHAALEAEKQHDAAVYAKYREEVRETQEELRALSKMTAEDLSLRVGADQPKPSVARDGLAERIAEDLCTIIDAVNSVGQTLEEKTVAKIIASYLPYTAADALAEWQPIETAPKEGPALDILLYCPKASGTGRVVVAHWAYGGGEDQPRFGPAWFYWCGNGFSELMSRPTHWMPLPAPPIADLCRTEGESKP